MHRPERTLRQEIRALAAHDRLDLLDYIYFAVYIITTTGYGDIIPLSPFARFVVSNRRIFTSCFLLRSFSILWQQRDTIKLAHLWNATIYLPACTRTG